MSLPHGLQRALGVAVAFAADPKLLLLDEPFTGMNPEETRQMMEIARKVRDRGVTLLLVEHDMQAVMDCAIGSRCSISASCSPRGPPMRCATIQT